MTTPAPISTTEKTRYRRMWGAAWALIGLVLLLVALFGTLEIMDLIYTDPVPSPQALPGAE